MKCAKCKVDKDIECFGVKGSGFQPYCKDCNKQYQRTHYLNNKVDYIEKSRKNKARLRMENRMRLWEYYLNHPCVDCGETDPMVLDSDHTGNKSANIADLVGKGASWKKIKQELEFCVSRCANCHRRKTASQLGWYQFMALSSKG